THLPVPITTLEITSLGQFIDQVTPDEPDPRTGRRRDSGIYRGVGHVERRLLTSLDRLGGEEPPHTKRELESHILRNFIRYSRPHLDRTTRDEWELLVTAQHHGLPTRLLDWTYSPLVAAHFATATDADADRVVWRLDWQRVHRAFDLPELALLIEDVERLLGREGRPFTPWALFDRAPAEAPFACMIEPPSIDARIVAQAAVFTLCSDRTRAFDAFLADHGLLDALTRYIIPARHASRVRDQLDLVSIDERRLFPDLDGVAAQMRRYYS
ncbi:MAG TPA: FRG domain-containing protein, partial [Gemmatimonadaceae bacterium]|nr:FRG domain-containing protein [Gemmatimonadaceae bacterium]